MWESGLLAQTIFGAFGVETLTFAPRFCVGAVGGTFSGQSQLDF